MKVFISYSWNDAPVRHALVSEISRIDGMDVLYDQAYLRASEQIHPGISKMLNDADCIIVILTDSSLNSPEVLDELSRSHERGKKIIPFVHDSADPNRIPHFLRDSLQIRYKERTFDQALERLCAELKIAGSQAAQLQPQATFSTSPLFPP